MGVRYLPLPCCVLEQRHIYSPKITGNTQEVLTLEEVTMLSQNFKIFKIFHLDILISTSYVAL